MQFGQDFEKIFFRLSLEKVKYLQAIKYNFYTSEEIDALSYLANKFSKDTFILTTSIYSPAGIQDYGVKEGWVAETQNHPKVELWNLSSSQHLINPPKPSKWRWDHIGTA